MDKDVKIFSPFAVTLSIYYPPGLSLMFVVSLDLKQLSRPLSFGKYIAMFVFFFVVTEISSEF